LIRLGIIPLFLLACTSGCMPDELLKPIPPIELLHDNSSKVWIIQEDLEGEKDFSPIKRKDKQTLVFFEEGDFFLQKISDWGSENYLKGTFSLQSQDDTKKIILKLKFEHQPEQVFELTEYDENRFELIFTDNRKRKFVLVPLTRPDSNP
jgi:hypothetical protein